MDLIISITTVFVSSVIELWLSIPLGLAFGLNPFLIVAASTLGSVFAVFVVATFGENIRKWIIKKRYGEGNNIKKGRIYDVWTKYGTVGLGLLSPLLFGAPLGTAIGIALGARKNNLIIWMALGIIIWSAMLTAAGTFGLMSFETIQK